MKTTCKNGHDNTLPNSTYIDSYGRECCRLCRRMYEKTFRRKSKERQKRVMTFLTNFYESHKDNKF